MSLLHDLHVLHSLHFFVLSSDGWAWLIGLAQVGVKTVSVTPLSPLAASQLEDLHLPSLKLATVSPEKLLRTVQSAGPSVVCFHLSSESDYASLPTFVFRLDVPTIITNARTWYHPPQVWGPLRYNVLRHRFVGGLTTARINVWWRGPGPLHLVALRSRQAPERPFTGFLDPAVRLTCWRRPLPAQSDCWYPTRPFPWPWGSGPSWVEAPSVFGNGPLIQRPFTVGERCQLWDLRPDWAGLLPSLESWCEAHTPPLRLFVEVLLGCLPWIVHVYPAVEASAPPPSPDWGRERPPWLGDPHTPIPGTQIERLTYFGWVWEPHDSVTVTEAKRADGSAVDLSLWAVGGSGPGMEAARTVLRAWLHRVWFRRTYLAALRWLRSSAAASAFDRNCRALADALERLAWSTWWTWDDGSRLHFWRWPEVWRCEARDGALPYHTSYPPPRLRFPPIPADEPWMVEKDLDKLRKLLLKRYLVPGLVRLTTPRFPVIKIDSPDPAVRDIRVVWDASRSGVNGTMYTPSFFLPSLQTLLRRMESGMFCGDFDIGEQFHNFLLHPSEQQYHGAEIPRQLLTTFLERFPTLHVTRFMRWGRLPFGWQSAPYFALRMTQRALEFCVGPPDAPDNAFVVASVVLNLPGAPDYDPSRPRVLRLAPDGTLASALVGYFDDGRVVAPTQARTEQALRQVCSRLQFLGIQDAARKRASVLLRGRAWAGGVIFSDQALLRKLVTQIKWDKGRDILSRLSDDLSAVGHFDRTRFRSDKGFLLHLAGTYDFMFPFLRGFHLSEETWREDRDAEGWKMVLHPDDHAHNDDSDSDDESLSEFDTDLLGACVDHPEIEPLLDPEVGATAVNAGKAPAKVYPVPRFRGDLDALIQFFDFPSPVQVIVRPVSGAYYVAYGAGDASGEGFGTCLSRQGLRPLLRRGFWCTEASEQSSNWREFCNLVEGVREEVDSGRLVGCELWLATDNKNAANCWHHGSSRSRRLFELVLKLKKICLRGNVVLRLVHIAGTRMIQMGIDGLSRGELQLGQLAVPLAAGLPLHLTPIDRSPALRDWLATWISEVFRVATPMDWFYTAQQAGQYDLPETPEVWVWDLHPSTALEALEELALGRLKRHYLLTGVVLIPELLEPEWRRRFCRVVDCYFTIPRGAISAWPEAMHESLTVGLYFPLLQHRPWDWKSVPFLASFGAALSAMYKAHEPHRGDRLREFWEARRWIAAMPQRVVRDLLQSGSWRRFLGMARSLRGRGR